MNKLLIKTTTKSFMEFWGRDYKVSDMFIINLLKLVVVYSMHIIFYCSLNEDIIGNIDRPFHILSIPSSFGEMFWYSPSMPSILIPPFSLIVIIALVLCQEKVQIKMRNLLLIIHNKLAS
jgi:hypothetical protein